mgnify:CR=1 FL=1
MEDETIQECLDKINWLYFNNKKLLDWIKEKDPNGYELFNKYYNDYVKIIQIKETRMLSDFIFETIKLLFKNSYKWFFAYQNNKLNGGLD